MNKKTIFLGAITSAAFLASCASVKSMDHSFAKATNVQWSIVSMDGETTLSYSPPVITFGQTGDISGTGGCNRLIGSYRFDPSDKKLTVSPVGTTMMACPDEQMAQETKFLERLEDIESGEVLPNGRLLMRTKSGETLVGIRQNES